MWFLRRFVRSCKRSIRESHPEAACAAVLLLLSGFSRKRKHFRKDFCQPVTLAARFMTFTIHILRHLENCQRNLESFLKIFLQPYTEKPHILIFEINCIHRLLAGRKRRNGFPFPLK
jgi:hypothetical protein